MGLSSAINAAQSGLRVTSLRADTVATNVANAATPGYVRRSLSVGEILLGQETLGVRNEGTLRSQDEFIIRERRELSSGLGQASVLAATFQSLSEKLGDGIGGEGLFGAFSRFETALSDAALSPESATQANILLSSANDLAAEFNELEETVVRQRSEADREIAAGVEVVNRALLQVDALNKEIVGVDRTTNRAAALFDERQRALDTIAEYLPIQTIERQSGRLDVLTVEGVTLVSANAGQIEFSPSVSFLPGETLQSGALSGLSIGDIDLTPGAETFAAISSGVLGALFQLRDEDLPNFSAQLDTLASDLTARLSDDAIDPTKTPGDPGLFLATATPTQAGIAGRLIVNPTVDPAQGGDIFRLRDGLGAITEGPPGNGDILNRLLGAFTDVGTVNSAGLAGQFSSTELAAHFSSVIAQSRLSHETVLSATTAQHTALVEAEASVSGVDIDAQLQDLLAIEQAFAANARVIQVVGDLLDRLLEL